ncbi:DM13 domain-containing protein [Streptomyces sp. NBC_00090]|uniref:DM13 domain-containing protein n=1 Tax=Streptomyces sp. NBC_00090 TaxID=2903619 RepID=UPI00386719BF
MGRLVSKRWWAGTAVVAAIGVVAGLVWFKPWALWVDETVNETLPSATGTGTGTGTATATATATAPTSAPAPPMTTTPTGPVTVARGSLISHEHTTTGAVRIVRLADGTYTLRLEGLDTSNGPALRVWLSDAPVKEGSAGWHVFDDGRYVDLGRLKGNRGNQNYPLPADVDWSAYTSVSIWCDRFDVSFGAARIDRV